MNSTQGVSGTHHVLIYLNLVGTQTHSELFGHHVEIPFHACRITEIVIGNLLVHFQHSKAIFLKGKLSLLTSNAADFNGLLLLKSDVCRFDSLGRYVLELVRFFMFVYFVPCEEVDRRFYYCHCNGMNNLMSTTSRNPEKLRELSRKAEEDGGQNKMPLKVKTHVLKASPPRKSDHLA